ncbi:hypothetical protein N7470_006030 [Penicillium chermesinum]|nr:hypothetical protein N7470_006030 [Penicillium chermesinum]
MTSPNSRELVIAKTALYAALLRQDPTTVKREEIEVFHALLDTAIARCSHDNIQKCKEWLLQHVAYSTNRVEYLAKYLAELARSFAVPSAPRSKPSPQRRQIHILYLLNDLLHHFKSQQDPHAALPALCESQPQHILKLFAHVSAYSPETYPVHHRRLRNLLDHWSEKGYLSDSLIHRLREVVKTPSAAPVEELPAPVQRKRMFHVSMPYYDLPVGNWLQHLIPNATIRLRPADLKPLQFKAGPADEMLVEDLKRFLKEADEIPGTEPLVKEDKTVGVDILGQRIIRDATASENYYAWSRSFAQKMKKRSDGFRGRHRSVSEERIGRKRRHSEDSASDYTVPSDSRSISRSRPQKRGNHQSSRPRSRSRRSDSRESPYSPKEPSPPRFPPPHQQHQPPHHQVQYPPAYSPTQPAYPPQHYPLGHSPSLFSSLPSPTPFQLLWVLASSSPASRPISRRSLPTWAWHAPLRLSSFFV